MSHSEKGRVHSKGEFTWLLETNNNPRERAKRVCARPCSRQVRWVGKVWRAVQVWPSLRLQGVEEGVAVGPEAGCGSQL